MGVIRDRYGEAGGKGLVKLLSWGCVVGFWELIGLIGAFGRGEQHGLQDQVAREVENFPLFLYHLPPSPEKTFAGAKTATGVHTPLLS